MKNTILKAVVLSSLIALLFLGCDVLQSGLTKEIAAKTISSLGKVSVAVKSYNYLGFKDSVLTGTGVTVPISYETTVDPSKATLLLTVGYNLLDGTPISKQITLKEADAGTLSSDKKTFNANIGKALSVLDGTKELSDGILTVKVDLSGVKCLDVLKDDGTPVTFPNYTDTITFTPSGTGSGTAKVSALTTTINSTDFTFAVPLTIASLTDITVFPDLGKTNFTLSLSTDKKTLTVAYNAALQGKNADLVITVNGVNNGSFTGTLPLGVAMSSIYDASLPMYQTLEVRGEFDKWSTPRKMSFVGNSTWVAKISVPADNATNNPGWDSATNWEFLLRINGTDGPTTEINSADNVSVTSSNVAVSNWNAGNWMIPWNASAKDYYIVYNQKPGSEKLVVTEVGVNAAGATYKSAATPQIYVRGFNSKWDNTDCTAVRAMTHIGGNEWVAAIVSEAASNQYKVSTSDWSVINLGGSSSGIIDSGSSSDVKITTTVGDTVYFYVDTDDLQTLGAK